MQTVEVVVVQGASPSSVAVTFETLSAANMIRHVAGRPPAFDVAASGSGAASLSAWIPDVPTADSARTPDIAITPGLSLKDASTIEAGLRRADVVQAAERLRQLSDAGSVMASSCSGVFLLAEAGILSGRSATTSWWLAPVFRARYPEVNLDVDAMVITDRKVVTAGAAMAQLDLMLTLIARHADLDTANRCASYMLIDKRTAQSRYMALSFLSSRDDEVAKAERWVRARLDQPFDVEAMASAVGLGVRTFARRLERATGLSPVQFVQRLRLEHVVQLLETTRLPFEEIANRVGYAEPSTLRRLLRRQGISGARDVRARAKPSAAAE